MWIGPLEQNYLKITCLGSEVNAICICPSGGAGPLLMLSFIYFFIIIFMSTFVIIFVEHLQVNMYL